MTSKADSSPRLTAPTNEKAASDSPHTPGPWSLAPCSHGGAILLRGSGHQQSHLQIVPEADARLIAAAPDLLAALKEMREACCAAMRVVADLDTTYLIGIDTDTRQQRFVYELRLVGVTDGFGARTDALIAKAEGRQ